MAELDTSAGSRKKIRGVKKSKKLSTRVDLTPMVDLGFLLITFFIFTTSMTRPTAMRLRLPDDTDPRHPNEVAVSAVITLLLGKGNDIYYYEGLDPANGHITAINNIRSILLDKKRRTKADDLEVIIKPSAGATYGNTVNILDEMLIENISRYALVDITPYETQILQTKTPNP